MRRLSWICLFVLCAAPATAATVCREVYSTDFGPVVSSPASRGYLIQDGCPDNRLVTRRLPPLTIRMAANGRNPATESEATPRQWVVLFGFDRSDLDAQDKSALDGIPAGLRVRVDGYTCRLGGEAYNQRLSDQRASAVAGYLKERGLTVVVQEGHGECCPVSATDLAANRRVVVTEVSR
ncbi:outer membrane protein OmpA-like peptidoglycan-associated protein [Geothermobacter ehrlichii]|uniref:Outer membrane protein OmpA-like peptidoglycan-associated protein n=1 Tax=Geothermobacter ehrlichii TaxID=213224 RepID=A0A5D3WFW3_9BACT|nr:OmpA family protein [Geothermobacter ehrlichii]TYO96797.1 outer membrane protein OmpA-like peptidoglycan-associated protein [Geothermobacter ehrlichii]